MLSSQEIITLITALGTGIGPDEFDGSKVRYHKIVLMTDADVDGSHIRTLLLTFFYRQMRELVERGYIYIAQPPLYKVQKGKKEIYVKDDEALEKFLVDNMLEAVEVNSAGKRLLPDELRAGVLALYAYDRLLDGLRKRIDAFVVDALVRGAHIDVTDINAERVESLKAELYRYLVIHSNQSLPVEVSFVEQEGEATYGKLLVTTIQNGAPMRTVVSESLLKGFEFRELKKLVAPIDHLGAGPFRIKKGQSEVTVVTIFELLKELDQLARKGQTIQRYKGLGEMNPEQLWETTLDPDVRSLLQIRIEDAVEADEAFSNLMGDEVEPRREFIEAAALDAVVLDI